jgi:hypothetical protein
LLAKGYERLTTPNLHKAEIDITHVTPPRGCKLVTSNEIQMKLQDQKAFLGKNKNTELPP